MSQTHHNALGEEVAEEPHSPGLVTLPHPLGRRGFKDLGNDALRVVIARHSALLAVLQTPLIFLIERDVVRVLGKLAVGPGNVGFNTASNDRHDAHAEGRELNAESVAVLMEGGLGRVIDAWSAVSYWLYL